MITLFVVSQGIKTWNINAAFCTRVIVFGLCCTVFFGNIITNSPDKETTCVRKSLKCDKFFMRRQLVREHQSTLNLVEKTGQFGQYKIPRLQRDLCRDRCCSDTEVPQFPQVTLTFRSKTGIVGDF